MHLCTASQDTQSRNQETLSKPLDLMEKEIELHSLPKEYWKAHPKPGCHH